MLVVSLSLAIILMQAIVIVMLIRTHFTAKQSTEHLKKILSTISPSDKYGSKRTNQPVYDKQTDEVDVQIPVSKDGLEQVVTFRRNLLDEIKRPKGSLQQTLPRLLRILDECLEYCGVQRYSPEIGQSFRHAFGVASNPDLVQCDDANKHWTIAKVVEPGLVMETQDGKVCLQRSRVSVFNFSRR